MNKVKISTEYIKLSQFMKMENLAQSGGEAKHIILDGLVSVNNEICAKRGTKLYNDDIIEFKEEKYIIKK